MPMPMLDCCVKNEQKGPKQAESLVPVLYISRRIGEETAKHQKT